MKACPLIRLYGGTLQPVAYSLTCQLIHSLTQHSLTRSLYQATSLLNRAVLHRTYNQGAHLTFNRARSHELSGTRSGSEKELCIHSSPVIRGALQSNERVMKGGSDIQRKVILTLTVPTPTSHPAHHRGWPTLHHVLLGSTWHWRGNIGVWCWGSAPRQREGTRVKTANVRQYSS
ncbi:hypothetical protein BD414DRAFT_504285 [Trametes punicea]|nr:hypothetical protein BD414DRAFT_504285 [Trametes punicea]